jgi:4-hydroxybenzoate polyprenyltransferase
METIEFLQNNALWLTIGTLILGGYLLLKSIQLSKKHKDKTEVAGFILSAICSGVCLIVWGCCHVLLQKDGKSETLLFLFGMWTGALVIALISFIAGKFSVREPFIEPFKISQRELNERIEVEKKTMNIAVK